MFAVIYRFKVRPGYEQQFQDAWSKRTEEIRTTYSSLGSRLHKASDEFWIAYAQWPNRETWETAGQSTAENTEAQLSMRAACDTVETLYELDLVKDLLEPLK